MGRITNPERYLDTAAIEKVVAIASFHSQVPNENVKPHTFAIADIHGMDESLLALLELVTAECVEKERTGNKFIFLGDYVDRGPGVAQVIAIVRLLQELMPKGKVTTLTGSTIFSRKI